MPLPPKTPPRFVPTLTDVVHDAHAPAMQQAGVALPPMKRRQPDDIEEQLIHRVMQRVDVALDQRMREAIAAVVQEQTRSLVPRLREAVEFVVRDVVHEAVAQELSGGEEKSF